MAEEEPVGKTLSKQLDGLKNVPSGIHKSGLVLKDDQNRVRVLLGLNDLGEPYLAMVDRYGTTRVALTGGDITTSLFIMDDKGNARVQVLLSEEDGGPAVLLSDCRGQTRLDAGLDKKGASAITLVDAYGQATWRTPDPPPLK